ncbi:MAG: phosphodiesterase, partial [Comamonas sp.]|nr:phosphodiesterase [Comamonas sp.]
MPTTSLLPAALATDDDHYEDLLGLWSDLEASLHLVLTSPALVPALPVKIQQLETWMRDLVAHDTDAALYLMFQLAGTSTVGYSASHALVCATLCQILATSLQLPPHERHSLVRA